MNTVLRKNELFQASHIMILIAYTIFSFVLIGEAILLSWEIWALPLVLIGVLGSWGLHITQGISEYGRLWVYSILMMVTFFFYGVHETSTFDLAPVMTAVIMLYSMTGVSQLILLNMITYYVTMGYDILTMVLHGEKFDSLLVTRTLLHLLLIFMVGMIARVIILKWIQVLYRAEKDIAVLQDSTRRMDDFLANVSHEIRTPINAVIGLIPVMLEKERDYEIREDMYAVRDAGHRVARQIGDILDYTEIDMEKLVVTEESYMLSSLVNDLIQELSGLLRHEIELVVDVDADLESVLSGDASKVKKILWHLITNGIKFTKTGGVYVHLFSAKRPYGINLCMEVKDTGIGMDELAISKMNDHFFQSNSGRARSVGGLGLGFSIVSGFVQQMGGFLTIQSAPDEGTTVTVSIPQKVLDQTPCMSLKIAKERCVGGFFHFEKYEHPQVREFYNGMISNLAKGLGVPFYRTESIDGLRALVNTYQLTHLIVGAEEYFSGAEYIESLTSQMIVTAVVDKDFIPIKRSGMKILRKPFYCFPIVNILNMDLSQAGSMEEEKRMYCRGVRALVVDDEPMNLVVAKGVFENYGMKVDTVNSGPAAIELCGKKEFDLIFMDHMMPEMDGIEAMHQLRALEKLGESKKESVIIALTANAVSSAREMFLSEGFDGFVPKPIEIVELERVLKRVLPSSMITYEHVRASGEEAEGQEPEPDRGKPEREVLGEGGIQMEKGLYYCQGDREFYHTLLLEYAKDAEEKERAIRSFYEERDWKNYAIRIHAIKSTSKMIGAERLSELARSLEEAAKAEEEQRVEAQHDEALKAYRRVCEAIRLFCHQPEEDSDSGEEVLEFAPEKQDSGEDILEFLPGGEEG